MSKSDTTNPSGQRGPADHAIREQIITAANEHFSHYGYAKTTVADLAKEVGFSKAYIYRFFESKQAIGEAICMRSLNTIVQSVTNAVIGCGSATDRFRQSFRSVITTSVDLFFNDRKLYDIAAYSAADRWQSNTIYNERLLAMVREIVLEGRQSGEFERKTPLDETCRAILQVMQPFINPLMLQHNLDLLPDAPNEVSNLVLRSLAP